MFSIDYGLAPDHPFPEALDDVWQAYCWIVNHAEEQLGIIPESILLVGDSAGANLALGVALLAIQKQFRRPDALLLAYPALRVSLRAFTPSVLYSLKEPILSLPFLRLCFKSYLTKTSDPVANPYLSPLNASDELLS